MPERNKISPSDHIEIARRIESGESYKEIGASFDVTGPAIRYLRDRLVARGILPESALSNRTGRKPSAVESTSLSKAQQGTASRKGEAPDQPGETATKRATTRGSEAKTAASKTAAKNSKSETKRQTSAKKTPARSGGAAPQAAAEPRAPSAVKDQKRAVSPASAEKIEAVTGRLEEAAGQMVNVLGGLNETYRTIKAGNPQPGTMEHGLMEAMSPLMASTLNVSRAFDAWKASPTDESLENVDEMIRRVRNELAKIEAEVLTG